MTKHTPRTTLEQDIDDLRERLTLAHCQINKPKAEWHPCGCDSFIEALDRIAAKARVAPELLEAAENALWQLNPKKGRATMRTDALEGTLEKAIRKARGDE